jgi:ERCC4-related helicase
MMRQVILERYMFEKAHVTMVWEDLLDTLGVDQVRINPEEDPDYMEYPDKVELTVIDVRVV